ncbi:hypothetical protein BG36_16990 [Aquamicrobium defluvii]|uniref:Uncharacterized protein n=1 Tax=Aquamicrobium defluvii TaxID=69279 RepID=A0A011TCZ2_9HYPH|nr:hypothetical protein [Aquamicrobium defluvii]EXL01752.1 hypothetical protein BG36_16990 [Aquamicrobium defluvii]EZQ12817.1 hypothetical protein CF98_34095 [Halopseudomonas bauzanensis]
MVGLEQLPGDFLGKDVIEPIHADAQSRASHCALAHLLGAAVIAIGAALACVEHETGTAMATAGDAGKERGSVDDAWSDTLRVTALEQALHRVEGPLINDCWHLELDPFGR